jgi:hypothetical protein
VTLFFYKLWFKLILPVIIGLILIVYWDPFKVFFKYQDYYSNNLIPGNREHICLDLLQNNPNNISNFIIGSSRSLAFKTTYWSKKIKEPVNSCFHYDGSGFGLYRALNAFRYLNEKHNVNNVLLIIDIEFFSELSNPKEHLFIQPPSLTNESNFIYYLTFIKASIDLEFLLFNILNRTTGKYYEYMGDHLRQSKNFDISNNSTGDLDFGCDQVIKTDSISYYSNLLSRGEFFDRKRTRTSKPLIFSAQLKLLDEINSIVKENNINLKIVISPLYNQIAFNESDKLILFKLFGKENVFDFSGENIFTRDYANYYEHSHYRPFIANQILDIVY